MVLSLAAIRAGLHCPALLPDLRDDAWPQKTFPRTAVHVRFGTYFYFTFTFTDSGSLSEKGKAEAAWKKSWAHEHCVELGTWVFSQGNCPVSQGPSLSDGMWHGGHGLLLSAWEMCYWRLPGPRVLLLVNLIIQLGVQDDGIIRNRSSGEHFAEMKK